MTIIELYHLFLIELKEIYSESEAENITSWAFENICGTTKATLLERSSASPDNTILNRLNSCLASLKLHKPIQYILGESWFYKMKFNVTPDVLIPRPETEELTEMIIKRLKNKPGASVLDIGTGSGCIAIAIKKNLPQINVTAIDISDEALQIAKGNAIAHETDIHFHHMNFLDHSSWAQLATFDFIISNPPYIPAAEKKIIDRNIKDYEPATALFVDDADPFIFYKKIASFGLSHLNNKMEFTYSKDDSQIFMECHENLALETNSLFNNEEYQSMILKDMQGKNRMIVASRHYR